MPAETYKVIDFAAHFKVIPPELVKANVQEIKKISHNSLVPGDSRSREIGENIAVAALCAGGVAEGLLINNNLAVIPVISVNKHRLIAIPRENDKSVLLCELNSDVLSTFNRCRLSQGGVVEPGYLSLHAKNFRFSAEEEAGMYDYRTAPVSRYATQVHAIASQNSDKDNILQIENFLLNMWLNMTTFPGL
ncbi:hypothetical protein HYT02_01995 [Candidatus Gottesmanbacteria bacterium]|nr:hypothetical protein [Candidatus Gottesmanbacteria bacterium]